MSSSNTNKKGLILIALALASTVAVGVMLMLMLLPSAPTPKAENPATSGAIVAPPPPDASKQALIDTTPEAEAPPSLSVDVWRVDAQGEALISGRAPAESTVQVLLNDIPLEMAITTADARGNFVILFTLTPEQTPALMSVMARTKDGQAIHSPKSLAVEQLVPSSPVLDVAKTDNIATADKATTPPTTLLVDDAGQVQVMQSPPSDAVISIETITYPDAQTVQLTGRGLAEHELRLYIDNDFVTTTTLSAQGNWSVILPPIEPGLRTLRADLVDKAGQVVGRFETPFNREDIAAREQEAAKAAKAAEVAGAAEPTQDGLAAKKAPKPITVTVQPGASLWRIARNNYGEGILYVQIYQANKNQIRDPDLIYPGQILNMPQAAPATP